MNPNTENKEIQESFRKLKEIISTEKKIVKEMSESSIKLDNSETLEERKLIISHLVSLKESLKKYNDHLLPILENTSMAKPLAPPAQKLNKISNQTNKPSYIAQKTTELPKIEESNLKQKDKSSEEITALEKLTIKRIKKKKDETKTKKKETPSLYVKIASRMFSEFSKSLIGKEMFQPLNRDLIKANLQFVPLSYISATLFTTFISIFVGIFIFLFFLFFNVGADWPIITRAAESIGLRLLKTFWIIFVVPISTFLIMYFYPSLEKKSAENKINQELPFATIHMSAISSSMIEPSKIFKIVIATGEYPHIAKEFTKLMNEVNVHGFDLVSALKRSAFNSPSKKLSELFNGLATTITSGGDLPNFFDKRAQTLLFEHKIEREKYTRSAETFMDIYISVVIAAPMILMLLLIMMKISGLGISLSLSMITLVMVLGVSVINAVFLTFLYLKQQGE